MTAATPTPLTADTLVQANVFLGYIADRYRERTARSVFGFRIPTMSREVAMQFALVTFDFTIEDVPFGHADYGWDREHANELVDEDLRHWDC